MVRPSNQTAAAPQSDSPCECPLIEFRVTPKLAAATGHFGGNSRDAAKIAECQLAQEVCRGRVNWEGEVERVAGTVRRLGRTNTATDPLR